MGPLEGCQSIPYQLVCTNQLNLILIHYFDFTGFAEKRVASLQWTKLALTATLPGTTIVITNTASPGIEQCLLGLLNMGFRNEVTHLVHRKSSLGSDIFCTD
jgi:hypothetical protein